MNIRTWSQSFLSLLMNGLNINTHQAITKDLLNSVIFCSTVSIFLLGVPADGLPFNGVATWVFRTIYPQYSEMDLYHQFNFETLIWSQVKITLLIALPVFLFTIVWVIFFYKINKKFFSNSAPYLCLFIYRFVFTIQSVGICFVPLLTIKILDENYYLINHVGIQTQKPQQLPIRIMKEEMVCIGIVLSILLLIYAYQLKKFLNVSNVVQKKWCEEIKQKFNFFAVIPIMFGLTASSYFSALMKTRNVMNQNIFLYNQCVYFKKNENIPDYNGIKATLQEVGCKKYTDCFVLTDERLRSNCLSSLYANSNSFRFLVRNERRNICRN